jgi:hypothetical protein
MSELYRYDASELMAERNGLAAAVESPLLAVLCKNVAIRAKAKGYLEFGPYWFAVKAALTEQGYVMGNHTSPYMQKNYTVMENDQPSPALTLIAAWKCADEIRSAFFRGSREFPLDDLGENTYSLFDPDMEG